MAFLDNSGDIILDAVLTDAGRQRMARGDFKIVKFALGDEEINYEIFNTSHPSGSAYYDLEIMQTPILEAFTNNTSLMKTKLLSLNRNNVLFMPKLAVNHKDTPFSNGTPGQRTSATRTKAVEFDGFYLLADDNTVKNGAANDNTNKFDSVAGALAGTKPEDSTDVILIDQGIDGAGELPITTTFPADMVETAYMVKVDHRLIRLDGVDKVDSPAVGDFDSLSHSFVDDDAVATYYIANGDTGFINQPDRHVGRTEQGDITTARSAEAFDGPLGTRLCISPRTTNAVRNSDGFFNELGSAANTTGTGAKNTVFNSVGATNEQLGAHKYIDTIINVVGVTTGYSLDIPIRIIKKS